MTDRHTDTQTHRHTDTHTDRIAAFITKEGLALLAPTIDTAQYICQLLREYLYCTVYNNTDIVYNRHSSGSLRYKCSLDRILTPELGFELHTPEATVVQASKTK